MHDQQKAREALKEYREMQKAAGKTEPERDRILQHPKAKKLLKIIWEEAQ